MFYLKFRLAEPDAILAEYLDIIGGFLIIILALITCYGILGSAKITALSIVLNIIVLVSVSVYLYVYSNIEYINLKLPENLNVSIQANSDILFLPFGFTGLVKGIAICFNAYIGFDAVSTCAEETVNPSYNLPIANFISVSVVAIVTTIASLSLVLYNPWYLVDTESPFLIALQGQLHPGELIEPRRAMFYVVGVGCLVGLISSILSNLVSASRISYSMAQDRILPNYFSHVCEPFKVNIKLL